MTFPHSTSPSVIACCNLRPLSVCGMRMRQEEESSWGELSLSEWLQKQKDIKILFTQTQRIQFNSIRVCICVCRCVCTGSSTLMLCASVRVCVCVLQQQIVYHSSLPYIIKRLSVSLATRATLPITANTLHSNTPQPFRSVLSSSLSLYPSLSTSLLLPLSLPRSVFFTPCRQSINWAAVICGQRRKVFANCRAYATSDNNNYNNNHYNNNKTSIAIGRRQKTMLAAVLLSVSVDSNVP